MKNQNKWICIWLAVIAFLLLAGVILFAAYVYKFDPLTPFVEIFSSVNSDLKVMFSGLLQMQLQRLQLVLQLFS